MLAEESQNTDPLCSFQLTALPSSLKHTASKSPEGWLNKIKLTDVTLKYFRKLPKDKKMKLGESDQQEIFLPPGC